MTWRLAGSLVKLRDQINAAYPNRSKMSDGTIGDTAHAATVSDHNPNADGVVTAFDITHDPAHGVDIDKLSDALTASRDPRIKYLIANNQILVPQDFGWVWQPYVGVDPHTSHLHVSVYGDYDNQAEWKITEEYMYTPDINTMRWLNYGLLGRDGRDGRKHALKGEVDKDIIASGVLGMKFTTEQWNKFVSEMGNSKEANAVRVKYDDTFKKRDELAKKVSQIKDSPNGDSSKLLAELTNLVSKYTGVK